MKLIFARFICLNAVVLLTSGILFGAIDLKSSISTSIKNTHYSSKSDLCVDTFSFFEEDEEEDENHIIDLSCFFNDNSYRHSISNKKIEVQDDIISKDLLQAVHKTPIWIKYRHIII